MADIADKLKQVAIAEGLDEEDWSNDYAFDGIIEHQKTITYADIWKGSIDIELIFSLPETLWEYYPEYKDKYFKVKYTESQALNADDKLINKHAKQVFPVEKVVTVYK